MANQWPCDQNLFLRFYRASDGVSGGLIGTRLSRISIAPSSKYWTPTPHSICYSQSSPSASMSRYESFDGCLFTEFLQVPVQYLTSKYRVCIESGTITSSLPFPSSFKCDVLWTCPRVPFFNSSLGLYPGARELHFHMIEPRQSQLFTVGHTHFFSAPQFTDCSDKT